MGFLAKALGSGEQKATVAHFDAQTHKEWLQRQGYVSAWGPWDEYTKRSTGPEAALEASAVYACVKILGEDMGALPFLFFRRTGPSSVEKARDDWRWNLLHGQANPDMSSGEFVEALTATAALTGNAFADIEWWDRGRQAWLWPRDPATVNMSREERGKGNLRRVIYEIDNQRVDSRRLFHFRGFSLDGAAGDSILSRARRALGLYLSAQEYSGRWFSQGIHTDLVFEHPGEIGPDEVGNILEAWRVKMGLGKVGEPSVLGEGMKANRLSPDLRKQQLIEARKFQLLEVCRMFRIQPHKISELERATFNNIEELQIDHVVNTLGRWRRRWSESVHRHLLTDDERRMETVYAEHSVEALLRGNFERQADAWTKLLGNGVYSINEVRAWLNLNPVDGGDEHRVQMQMADIRSAADELVKALQMERANG